MQDTLRVFPLFVGPLTLHTCCARKMPAVCRLGVRELHPIFVCESGADIFEDFGAVERRKGAIIGTRGIDLLGLMRIGDVHCYFARSEREVQLLS